MNLDSTLAVTNTCPKDGVHLSLRDDARLLRPAVDGTYEDGERHGFRHDGALVHNSRSRSIIALHPEIRGPA